MKKVLVLIIMFVCLSLLVFANIPVRDKVPELVRPILDKLDLTLVQKQDNLKQELVSEPDKYFEVNNYVYKIIDTQYITKRVSRIERKFGVCGSFLKFGNSTCVFGLGYTDSIVYDEIIEPKNEVKHVGYVSKGNVINKYGLNSGCFIDPLDDDMLTCYSNIDGFAENIDNKWRSTCKSGTSCYRQIISTGEVISVRSDVGIIN